jgi:hypothetical protein
VVHHSLLEVLVLEEFREKHNRCDGCLQSHGARDLSCYLNILLNAHVLDPKPLALRSLRYLC